MSTSTIDMYDLPTEAELGEKMMEAAKENRKVGEIETKTIFPFWAPVRGQHNHVVSDKTGVVKPKADMKRQSGDVMADWKDFLSKVGAASSKAATGKVENFGSVVVKNADAKPDPKKVSSELKALKTTTVKDMNGKTTTKTEEIGIGSVVTKSNAASPKVNGLVGIVSPKAAMGKQNIPNAYAKVSNKPTQATPSVTKVYNSYNATLKPIKEGVPAEYSVKSSLPGVKKQSTVVSDKTGVVKPKSALNVKK